MPFPSLHIENAITERLAGGTTRVRFQTVEAAQTPAAMDELHERFDAVREACERSLLRLRLPGERRTFLTTALT